VLDVTPLKGDVLPGWYDDWVLFARERYRQLRVRALEILSAALCGAGLYADAIEMALSAIEADPLRESSHRALINVCIAEGNPADAIREFESYRGLLARELGVSPSRAIEKLVEPLRAG
jgi:DNA-binding SARP family transcriptional activator